MGSTPSTQELSTRGASRKATSMEEESSVLTWETRLKEDSIEEKSRDSGRSSSNPSMELINTLELGLATLLMARAPLPSTLEIDTRVSSMGESSMGRVLSSTQMAMFTTESTGMVYLREQASSCSRKPE